MDSAATSWRTATWRASFVLLRDELLEREAFDTLLEAKVLIERWRQQYNTIRPHGALGYRAPPERRCSPVWVLRLRLRNHTGLVC